MSKHKHRIRNWTCLAMILTGVSIFSSVSGKSGLFRIYLDARTNRPEDRYIIPSRAEINAFETFFHQVLKCHDTHDFRSVRELNARGHMLGFKLGRHTEKGCSYTWIQEANHCRGSGFYMLASCDSHKKKPVVIQAPHARSDARTGILAWYIFRKTNASAFFSSTMKRNTPAKGTPVPDGPAPADLAHQPQTLFQGATQAFYYRHPDTLTIQLHGFKRIPGDTQRDFDMILSTGLDKVHENAIHQRLKALFKKAFQGLHIGIFPENVQSFGAQTNVQGRFINTRSSGVFLHIELSDTYREKLISNRKLKQAFAKGISKVIAGYETL